MALKTGLLQTDKVPRADTELPVDHTHSDRQPHGYGEVTCDYVFGDASQGHTHRHRGTALAAPAVRLLSLFPGQPQVQSLHIQFSDSTNTK